MIVNVYRILLQGTVDKYLYISLTSQTIWRQNRPGPLSMGFPEPLKARPEFLCQQTKLGIWTCLQRLKHSMIPDPDCQNSRLYQTDTNVICSSVFMPWSASKTRWEFQGMWNISLFLQIHFNICLVHYNILNVQYINKYDINMIYYNIQ